MKKLLTLLGFIPKTQTNTYNQPFIFIEKDSEGRITVEANKNMNDQDILDITTQYFREVINPILDKQFAEKQTKRKAEFLVKNLISEIEGIKFSKN